MESNGVIEIVAPLDGRFFFAGPSSFESDVALFVSRIDIPVIGGDGQIGGVLCRNSRLSSVSTPQTENEDTGFIGEASKRSCTTSQTSLPRSIVGCSCWSARQTLREGK